MKKKIISICITLFIFLSSTVGVFAVDLVSNTQVPYWLLDIYHQCWLSTNAGDVTFGLATYGPTSRYLVDIVRGGALYLTYEVPAGETVYFRWAIARNNMGNFGWSTYVRMSVDGSHKFNHTYNYSNLGDYGTYGSIVIVEDYTNTSNSKQLVTYVITNDGVASAGSTSYSYVPILVGTDVLIEQGTTDFSDFDYTVDLTGVEDKLDDIIELLQQREEDIDFEVPFELWQIYSFFIEHYSYSYSTNADKIPWLIRNGSQLKEYNNDLAFRRFDSDVVYFSILADSKDTAYPLLLGRDGSTALSSLHYISTRSISYGVVYTFKFHVDIDEYYTLYLPNESLFNKIIPLYIGYGFDVPESIEELIGLPSERTKLFDNILSMLNSICDKLDSTGSAEVENSKDVNSQLFESVNNFDNLEKNQVQNMEQSLNNLPTLDFNTFNDFAPTVQFVSSTMQQIYDSNDFLQLLINTCLLIGIALLLIGRGVKK